MIGCAGEIGSTLLEFVSGTGRFGRMGRFAPAAICAGALALALIACAMLQAAATPTALTMTANATDPVVTGSIPPEPAPARPQTPGSDAFQSALAMLKTGSYADAHAAAAALPDSVERRAIEWAAIYYGNGEVPYEAVQAFQTEAPGFVLDSVFQTRFEQALTRAKPDGASLIKALGDTTPNTVRARIALAEAYLAAGDTGKAAELARSVWIENYLDAATEKQMLGGLGTLLRAEDHWARAMHLMMNDRARGAERLMEFLSPAQQSLVVARSAVSRNAKDAKALLDKVDPSMHANPVYVFSRVQRARQFDLNTSALDWLDKATGDLPDAQLWWFERQALARKFLSVGEPQLAYRAAANYTSGPEGRLVEARFLAGWIALSFLRDASAARAQFEEMARLATLPDTITQANYWLGRALLVLGDQAGARDAFTAAAEYGTVYYGLLARNELGLKGAGLRNLPSYEAREAAFEARDEVKAVRLLAANGRTEMAQPLLRTLADKLTEGGDMLLAARLAQDIGAHHLAISIADTAERRGIPLDLFSFPKEGLPTTALAAIDQAAVLAVTRQESRFQPDAASGAGALGLMQLMPATAKETAAKLGVDYSRSRLTSDPEYNTLLGSTYLADQLERYDGSLLLAAAAYNAGAGNANKWIAAFGDPRADNVDPVIWVELIPFAETRKYVQRVLGNYLVYRTQLGDSEMTIPQAMRRIPG